MTFVLTVIKGCPFCDELLKIFPELVKKYQGVSFSMRCVSEDALKLYPKDTVFPIVGFVHLGVKGEITDEIKGALFEQDVIKFIERNVTRAIENDKTETT